MAISAHFRHTGFTPEKHDEAIRRLDAAGHGAPAGRLHHVAIETDGEIEVLDIWESEEALQAWGPQVVRADPSRARRRASPTDHSLRPKHHQSLKAPIGCTGSGPRTPSAPAQSLLLVDCAPGERLIIWA